MSAHLTCSICGRYPWQELDVHLNEEGVALCNGADCGEVAAKKRAPTFGRRGLMSLAMLSAALGVASPVGMSGARRQEPEVPTQESVVSARVQRAIDKRARRAAKRRSQP